MQVPTRIEVAGGRLVTLTWEDGRSQELAALQLRAACPCAGCRDAGFDTSTAGEVTIGETKLVGDYAINFVFEPGHHHQGIFSFDLLRSLDDG